MSESSESRLSRIVTAAESHFGKPVVKTSAPGGDGRSSFRIHFKDQSVIATLRPNFRRTHLEAHALEQISAHCDDVPRMLGVVGEILFQSDVGRKRLNVEIARVEGSERQHMAENAVAGIFRFQNAARATDLHTFLPNLGSNGEWYENFINAATALQPYGPGVGKDFDGQAVYERLAVPMTQFIKWDCRSGNAAIGADGKLRWFDFEYCGVRHGAEDIAWLIGDEAWPLEPDAMVDVVIDAFDPSCGHSLEEYFRYLSTYVTLHCIQRFKLILKEEAKRGWLNKDRVRKYDDAGVHPEFAAHICKVGAYFAAQDKLTLPLRDAFEAAMVNFQYVTVQEARREAREAARLLKKKRRPVLRV
ncbi:hypothetical protein [Puniceibacterium confluentis]|uniref:hypothetical protein n=1 Tax=Puniceibacterium confluentis TaxID=1958944 RepID=UPI0011B5CEF0|nr:hypothetical protein [Puniceibacterium confluentis]